MNWSNPASLSAHKVFSVFGDPAAGDQDATNISQIIAIKERLVPWSATAISAALRVRITRDMPKLPDDLDEAVERAWRQACDGNPRLFNGRIVSADHVDPTLIEGHCTEYRRVVAQLHQPDLAEKLDLRPLAVCGVITCWQNGRRAVLFGQRSTETSYHQGLWQMPPAGSVDPRDISGDGGVNLSDALLRELHEEVGLAAERVRDMQPLCMVEHPGSRVLDVAFALHTDLQADELLTAQAGAHDTDYVDARIVALADTPEALRKWGDQVTPAAVLFLAELQRKSLLF